MRFDVYAWILMCDINKIDFFQISTLPENKMLFTLMFAAYVSNCRAEAKRERYDLIQFNEIWSRLRVAEVDKIKAAILKSQILGKTIDEWGAEGEKKNQIQQ